MIFKLQLFDILKYIKIVINHIYNKILMSKFYTLGERFIEVIRLPSNFVNYIHVINIVITIITEKDIHFIKFFFYIN